MREEFKTQAELHGRQYNAPPEPLNIKRAEREEYDDKAQALLKRMKDKYQDGERSRTAD